jgi:hypothetical protein
MVPELMFKVMQKGMAGGAAGEVSLLIGSSSVMIIITLFSLFSFKIKFRR